MPGDGEKWGDGEPGEAGASALDDLESALEAEVKAGFLQLQEKSPPAPALG